MAGATMRGSIEVEGLRPLLSAMNKLPKDMNGRLRDASQEIATDEAAAIQAAGRSSDAQSRLVAPTVRARRDRVPAIVGGGAKRLAAEGRPKAMVIFFGAEFGGRKRKTTQQFRPHKGKQGYWFWPTLRRDEDRMVGTWLDAVDGVLDEWSES